MAYTQQELVMLMLYERGAANGGWLRAYNFMREPTTHGYIKPHGDRRARELVELGQAERRIRDGEAEFRITEEGLLRLRRNRLIAEPVKQQAETLFETEDTK